MKNTESDQKLGQLAIALEHATRMPSDINEHLPLLSMLASQSIHVTEFGVRTGCSTLAFLHGLGGRPTATLRSYDINDHFGVYAAMSPYAPINWTFICRSTLEIPPIEPTDLLFVDTLHRYEQVACELTLHGDSVRRWIAFHDTETFGVTGDDGGRGINEAISEWMAARPEWRQVYRTHRNNGLTVIERD